jgi:chemotaxis response regulator CheB
MAEPISSDGDRDPGGEDASPHLTVVGIGASAGGLAALKIFIPGCPPTAGSRGSW